MSQKNIFFGNLIYQEEELINVHDNEILSLQLSKLSEREARMKEAYLAGIDILEEYRANKTMLESKKQRLHSLSLEQLSADPDAITKAEMINRIKEAYSILSSDNYSYDEKAVLLVELFIKLSIKKKNVLIYISCIFRKCNTY